MNYKQTIDYLFSRLPMFSRIGMAAYKNNLDNIIRLCEYLGNPQTKFKTIHVAGTNGKGSVSHMLAAILQTAGYTTGLYTSPHLKDFRERIKINGQVVTEEYVIGFTENIKPLIEEIKPSFFEITVAMAFEYFAEQKVDIAVIEVGLGGRLDSTNIITPELSVITNIGWDHMNILGDSLEKIATEKAGIIKPGIPVVVGEVLPETRGVFEKVSEEKKSTLSIATETLRLARWKQENKFLVAEIAQQNKSGYITYRLDLHGIYQLKNLLTVLEACTQLQHAGWKINDEIIHKGLKQVSKLTGLHGRWEIIQHSPLIVLDVAHNADGFRQLAEQVESSEHEGLHIIIGMVKDKQSDQILHLLPKHADYYFTKAQIPRAIPEDVLAVKAEAAGLKGEIFPDVNTALNAALNKAGKNDLILICGSVFLIGEVNFPYTNQ
jgi:dihydrofolate synthase/folylpolyglutamate synthase